MSIGDWMCDEKTGHVFKIKEIWGDWLLQDDYIDSGDVSHVLDCRKATKEEIGSQMLKRRLSQEIGSQTHAQIVK